MPPVPNVSLFILYLNHQCCTSVRVSALPVYIRSKKAGFVSSLRRVISHLLAWPRQATALLQEPPQNLGFIRAYARADLIHRFPFFF